MQNTKKKPKSNIVILLNRNIALGKVFVSIIKIKYVNITIRISTIKPNRWKFSFVALLISSRLRPRDSREVISIVIA